VTPPGDPQLPPGPAGPADSNAAPRLSLTQNSPPAVWPLPGLDQLTGDVDRLQRLAVLGTLAGAIAHELNNLLTPVLTYAQLALDAPHDKALRQKALERAAANSERASRIISSILALAKDAEFSSPGFGEPREPTRALVGEAVREAIACLPYGPELEIHTDIEPGLWVRMRPVALQQVLLNLMLNAAEAMSGKGRISVIASAPERTKGATWHIADADFVSVTVVDIGPGMPSSALSRLLGTSMGGGGGDGQAKKRGAGLGLLISRGLVEEAGGRIGGTSEAGKGTSITISLPGARGG
jgi:signal transduction histidine kinase